MHRVVAWNLETYLSLELVELSLLQIQSLPRDLHLEMR